MGGEGGARRRAGRDTDKSRRGRNRPAPLEIGVVARRRFGGRDGLANAQEVTPTSVSRPVRGCRIEVPAAGRGPRDGPFRLAGGGVRAASPPYPDSQWGAL